LELCGILIYHHQNSFI